MHHGPFAVSRRDRRPLVHLLPVLILLLGLTGSGPAEAECPSGAAFSFFNYVFTPGFGAYPSVSPQFAGSFWALGLGDPDAGAAIDNGTWPAVEGSGYDQTGWAIHYPGYPTYIAGSWSAASAALLVWRVLKTK